MCFFKKYIVFLYNCLVLYWTIIFFFGGNNLLMNLLYFVIIIGGGVNLVVNCYDG